MDSRPPPFRFLLITDRRLCAPRTLEEVVEAAVAGGVDAVQLREKSLGGRDLLTLARRIRSITSGRALLLVNDRVDVARASGADGVHLPSAGIAPRDARRWLGAEALIGYSAHDAAEVRFAEAEGADYATLSPVFAPSSKHSALAPLGLDGLAERARATPLSIVALGGVTAATAGALRGAGAAALAVLGAVMAAEDPEAQARAIRAAFDAASARGCAGPRRPGASPRGGSSPGLGTDSGKE